jgi:dihydroorotase
LLATMLHFVATGDIDLPALVRMCSANPAQRFGIGDRKGALARGQDADILVLDPRLDTRISHAEQLSRAGYTPFDGMQVPGRLTAVFLRGALIYEEGRLAVSAPAGAIIGASNHGIA